MEKGIPKIGMNGQDHQVVKIRDKADLKTVAPISSAATNNRQEETIILLRNPEVRIHRDQGQITTQTTAVGATHKDQNQITIQTIAIVEVAILEEEDAPTHGHHSLRAHPKTRGPKREIKTIRQRTMQVELILQPKVREEITGEERTSAVGNVLMC